MFKVTKKEDTSIVVKMGFEHIGKYADFTIEARTNEHLLISYLNHMKYFLSQNLDYLTAEIRQIETSYRAERLGEFWSKTESPKYWNFLERKQKAQRHDTIKCYIEQLDGFDFSIMRKAGTNAIVITQDIISCIANAKKVVAKTDELLAEKIAEIQKKTEA